jgi:hydrophobic/amphiphilic exporter-1 (mainly G- bacteria), HAE1 family
MSSKINFSAWSIKTPVPSILLFTVLCLLGIMSFNKLPVTRFPNIDVPLISVTVPQSGAAPAELETQVTKIVEDAVANITGVKHLISTMTDGLSTTVIEFRLEVDTDRALIDVKDAIEKARPDMPRTIDEPIVSRIDVEGQAILAYAATSPGNTLEGLSWHVDDTIKRALQGLKGVGRVERYGGVEREIRILLNPDRLLAMGITAAEVNRQVRSTNVDIGSGRSEVGGQEQAIRILAGARTVEALAQTKIVLPGGRDVRLQDLGRIIDDATEPRSFATNNAEPVVSFSVFRSKGSSEISVKDAVEKKLAELKVEYPEIELTKIDDAVAYTAGNYRAAMIGLIEGALLAVLTVFLFLKNIRATLITAIALPLSIIPTFWAVSMLGFSLNLVSLLAITLVTGILVDDAIVEIENIVRHMRMGKSPYRASMEAADEIGLAVIAITFTIVAIFAPVSFMGGVAGQYFMQFGLVVAAAVLFSLLVARLITPMMAAYLMKPLPAVDHSHGLIMRSYLAFLRSTMNWKYITLVFGALVFYASIVATAALPTSFIPDEDNSRMVISIELPTGSRLDTTRQVTDQIVAAVRQQPEVKSVFVLGGTSPTGQLEVRRGAVTVLLVPKSERTLSQKKLKPLIAARIADIPDVRAWFVNERGERELAFSILSKDGGVLTDAVSKIEAAVRGLPGFYNVASKAALDRPEIRVVPRLDLASNLGVAPDQIAETVRVATLGDVGANLAKFTIGDRLVPIRVQLEESARENLQRIETMRITSASGRSIPLSAVADISFGRGPSAIDRYDRERRAEVGADLVSGFPLGTAREKFDETVKGLNLPKGVRLQVAGDAEVQDEVATGFINAMGTGLMIVLGLLILLFGSVFQPITILLSLPLSFGGVVAALLITNNSVSMPVYIGLLMLMGIVTKNAIMLVDFAVEEIARGTDRYNAMLEAGSKRARPIVMTTIAMAAGMLPSALAVGDGGEFRAPMAIAVIGGLIVSTVLSLVFVPSFFLVMDDLSLLVAKIFGRFFSTPEEAGDEFQDDPRPAQGPLRLQAKTTPPPLPPASGSTRNMAAE